MAIPYPGENEEKKDFIDRCINDEGVMLTYRDVAERYRVCEARWQTSGRSVERTGEDTYTGERIFTETEK